MTPELFPREIKLLDLLSSHSLKQSAKEMRLSYISVRRIASKLYKKIGVRNKTEAAVWYSGKSTASIQ